MLDPAPLVKDLAQAYFTDQQASDDAATSRPRGQPPRTGRGTAASLPNLEAQRHLWGAAGGRGSSQARDVPVDSSDEDDESEDEEEKPAPTTQQSLAAVSVWPSRP